MPSSVTPIAAKINRLKQRTAMFLDLMEMVDAMQSHLTPEEHARRMWVADQLDPRPDPWWRNVRKEALAEYQCQTSSM